MNNDPLSNDEMLRERIAVYLQQQTGHAVRVGSLKRFAVGFSWKTYLVPIEGGLPEADSAQELILRLGPDYGLFAPYSAIPEWLAMNSLKGTTVPVPKAYWAGDDHHHFGAPFLFSEKISGAAVVPWVPKDTPPLDEGYRKSLGAQFTDALAALHRVEWQQTPIAELGESINVHNAALQNVSTWEKRIQRWAMRPYPAVECALRWLKSHCPISPRVSIIHGDYRTGNFLELGGQITAILDWELVHLGDPHEDIGWLSLPMYMGGSPYFCRLLEPEWFYERYSRQAGFEISMSSMQYYRAFSLLKLTATHMAAARCFEEGRFNDLRMPAMGSQIAACLRQLDKTIEVIA
jgi:aminoglycoside phosphotransferase (APT) family kinase protein